MAEIRMMAIRIEEEIRIQNQVMSYLSGAGMW